MRTTRCDYLYVLLLLLVVLAAASGRTEELLHMRTMRQVAVFPRPDRDHAPIAKINYGAVVAVEIINSTRGCASGWGKLDDGGYVCLKHFQETKDALMPSPIDAPDRGRTFERYRVTKGGAMLFANRHQFGKRIPQKNLLPGSVLSVKETIVRGGTVYLITQSGEVVQGDNVEKLSPVTQLGQMVSQGGKSVQGYVINEGAVSRVAPNEMAPIAQTYSKFATLSALAMLQSSNGWVSLPTGEYMSDADVARVRTPDISFTPAVDEKWIAVDLQEQTVAAYVGPTRVFVSLASTGKKGNTEAGMYRIKWKRRMQTMNVFGGHLRVDDVQWVMYYIPQRGFALHSAWHNRFGYPVSHGCVNLPEDDARWLYEWTAPSSSLYDSENFDSEIEKGTRVIVF